MAVILYHQCRKRHHGRVISRSVAQNIKTLGHLSVAHMFHSIHTLQPLFFSALFSDSVGNIHLVGCCKRLLAKRTKDLTAPNWHGCGHTVHALTSYIRASVISRFFTDAAIFGSTMGLSCTTFFLVGTILQKPIPQAILFCSQHGGILWSAHCRNTSRHCHTDSRIGCFSLLIKELENRYAIIPFCLSAEWEC